MKNLNKRIRAARIRSGMRPSEWAEAMKVKRMSVWRWEHGKDTPHPAFVELAERIALETR